MSKALDDVTLVDAEATPAQAWRNGGGRTRELLAWPAGDHWRVRVSRADIAADGPFSAFPGIARWFTVLEGAGVVLGFTDGERTLRCGDEPLHFDGAAAPGCRLLDGATQDLNLMVRHGSGTMLPLRAGQAWQAAFAMRGLYTTVAGRWSGGGLQKAVPAHNLLWMASADAAAWAFAADAGDVAGKAWWLGFTPEE